MNPWNLIDQAFTLRLTIALLHFLWQGTLIAFVAAVAGWLLRNSSARIRYGVYVAALSLMALCVPVTLARVVLDAPLAAPASLTADSVLQVEQSLAPSAVAASDAAGANGRVHGAFPSPLPAAEFAAAHVGEDGQLTGAEVFVIPPVPFQAPESRYETMLRQSAPYVTAVYFAGVLVLLLRLLRGTWDSRRLRMSASELGDAELLQWVQHQAARLGLRVIPALRWSRQISVPVVLGLIRPVVLLPAAAATGLSPDQLRAVIAHELAHIRRYDLAVNLLQRMIETLLFFHPAVWWVSRRISREREEACDDLVLSAGYERTRYADALVRMAEVSWFQQGREMAATATGLAATGTSPTEFKRRILKILRLREESHVRPGRLALLLAITITVAAILAPAAWVYMGRSAAIEAAEVNTETDETLQFLQSLRPDSTVDDPAARGRELAQSDWQAGTKRILYFGEPWSAGKPLIDDDTGLPVEIVSGCIVTRDFVQIVTAYNAAIRTKAQGAAAEADHHDPSQHKTANQAAFELETQGNSVHLVFSQDGRQLAVANGNPSRTMYVDRRAVAEDWSPSVDIIDTETEQVAVSLDLSSLPHDDERPAEHGPTFTEVTAIAFTPDGATLAVGTSVGQLLLFDATTGKQVRQLDDEAGRLADDKTPEFWKQMPRALGTVKALAFSPDGGRIAVCGSSFADWSESLDGIDRLGINGTAPGRLKVFDVATGDLKFNPPAHSDVLADVAYSPDGRYLASAGRWFDSIEGRQFGDGVILWDATTGERQARIDLEIRGWMYDIEFSPDSKWILIGAQDFDSGGGNGTGVAAMLSTETLAVMWRRPIERSAMSVAFNPQQDAVIVLTNRKSLSYIAEESGQTEMRLKVADPEQKQRCESFAISRQGHLLAWSVVEGRTGQVRFLRIGPLDPNADQNSLMMQIQEFDGSPAAPHGLVAAHRGYDDAVKQAVTWNMDTEGNTVLVGLSPGEHVIAYAPGWEQRELFHVIVDPDGELRPETWEARAAPKYAGRDIRVEAAPSQNISGPQQINVTIHNDSAEILTIHERDITITTPELRVFHPWYRDIGYRPLVSFEIAPGKSQTIELNWFEWVQRGYWIPRTEPIAETWPLPSGVAGNSQIRINLGNIGSNVIQVTEPKRVPRESDGQDSEASLVPASEIKVGMTMGEVIAAKGKHYRPLVGMGVGQLFLHDDDITVGVEIHPNQGERGRVFRIDPTPPDLDQLLGDTPYADAVHNDAGEPRARWSAAEEAQARLDLELLAQTDPGHIHATARYTPHPYGAKWSLYLPPGRSWRIYCRSGMIPGRHAVHAPSGEASFQITRDDEARIIDLESYIAADPQDEGKLKLWVEADRAIFQSVEHAVWSIDPVVADYITGQTPNGGMLLNDLDVGRVMTLNAGAAKFRLPLTMTQFSPKIGAVADRDPLPGYCVWIEADSE